MKASDDWYAKSWSNPNDPYFTKLELERNAERLCALIADCNAPLELVAVSRFNTFTFAAAYTLDDRRLPKIGYYHATESIVHCRWKGTGAIVNIESTYPVNGDISPNFIRIEDITVGQQELF